MAALSDTNVAPDPDGGWSREIVTLKDAVLAPPVTSGTRQQCGVYTKDGDWCGHAATWRGRSPMTTPFQLAPVAADRLEGRHLWCGQIWAHFGHWLCESMSRFWAIDHVKDKLDGLVFLVKRPHRAVGLGSYQQEFLRLFNIDLPVRIISAPTEVEELVVPGMGFGIGTIARGTPEFKDFIHSRLLTGRRPEGPRKLYVSRSLLGGQMGGMLLENRIESNLKALGYTVYHPQAFSIADQLTAYRAADDLVAPDGSALHLFGMVANDKQKCAMILRRNSSVANVIVDQIDGFSGRRPDVIRAVDTDWVPKGGVKRASRNSFGQMNFGKIRDGLIAGGYIMPEDPWPIPGWPAIRDAVDDLRKRRGLDLQSMHVLGRQERKAARLQRRRAGEADGSGSPDSAGKGPDVKVTAVTLTRDDGPYLVEWIAWQRVIGTRDILIYSDPARDGSDVLLNALARRGIIQHEPKGDGLLDPVAALADAAGQRVVKAADWAYAAEPTDFLNISAGKGRIDDLVKAAKGAAAISLTSQIMANDGVTDFRDRPVTEQFTATHSPSLWRLEPGIDVRTLVGKSMPIAALSLARPFLRPNAAPAEIGRWCDGSGRDVPDWFRSGSPRRPMTAMAMRGARDFGVVNRYLTRSVEAFMLKAVRGTAWTPPEEMTGDWFQDRNDPARQDQTILRHRETLAVEMAALMKLEGVRDAHLASVEAHQAAIAKLRGTPEGRALFAEIIVRPKVSLAEAEFARRLETLGAA